MLAPTDSFELKVPKGLSLYPYQKEDAKFFIERGGGFLQHEMGCGKSVIISVALGNIRPRSTVVIAPAIMRRTWEAEIHKWSRKKFKIEVIDDETPADKFGRRLPQTSPDVLIVSYNWITKLNQIKWLKKNYEFDCLVCDEWHYCKSIKSKRTRYALLLMRMAKHKFAATGTPYTKSVIDLYTQLLPFARLKDIGENWVDFGHKFSQLVDTGFGREFQGVRNSKRLVRIQSKFAKRRLKKDVLKDLPPLTLSNIYVDIEKSIAKESLKYVEVAIAEITGQTCYVDPEMEEHIASIKRQLGIAKVKAAIEYLTELIPQLDCLVVFAYHKDVIAVLRRVLLEAGVSCEAITGSTSGVTRQRYIDEFQSGEFQVLLAQVSAGGIGVTYTRASRAVMVELDWSAATMEQAYSRLHRITQKNPVQIDLLVARKSLDSEIISSLRKKIKLSKKALGDK